MHSYRNICYDNKTKSINLWTWNESGDRVFLEIPFKPYIYLESQTIKDAVSLYNTPLRKMEFNNQYERYKYINECGIKRVFYNLQAEQQFLIENFSKINTTPDFTKYPLKVFFLDIETYSPDEFPNPMIAKDPINVITIYDTLSQTYYSWGLKKDYQAGPNVVYTKCDTEYNLIKKFIEFWCKDYPDIVSGWNIENFDIPYLINRTNNVLGEEYVKMFSPVSQVYSKENVVKRFGKIDSKWHIKGVSLLDYMEVYKVFSRSPRESYALNAIGEVELGEGKLSYNATSLSKLADDNWQLFVDYNIQDVTLLIKLEEKLKFLELSRMLSYLGLTQFESSLGTITVVTGAVACKALERNLIIPTFSTSDKAEYAGGYVKDPDRGLKEDIISFDANSLYPNTIITLNISPETKLGKIIDRENDEVTIQLVNGKQYKLSQDKLLAFIEKEKICLSKAGILFTQKSRGIYPEIIEGIYQDRVKNKKDLTQHKKDIKHCKEGSEKYIEHKKMINHLDINQYTLKILLNRMYGTFANKHSPFCDIDLAGSITLTGQACIKQASDIVDNHAKEKYGITRSLSTYSDTDSVIGSTLIRTNYGIIPIEKLYNEFNTNNPTLTQFGHETLKVDGLKCLTFDSINKEVKLGNVKRLIRHKTNKKLYKIVSNGKTIVTTEDHGLMVLRDNKLIRISPKDLKKDDKMINIY